MPKSKNKRKNGKPKLSGGKGYRAAFSIVDEVKDANLIQVDRRPADVQNWIERYHVYICDECMLGYEAVDLDEGATPSQGPCLRTEGCPGTAVSFPIEHGPEVHSDDFPVLVEFYRPRNLREIRNESSAVASHVIRGGLMRKASKDAPQWVKELL